MSELKNYIMLAGLCLAFFSCRENSGEAVHIKQMDSTVIATVAATIEASVKPTLEEGLNLSLWGIDSLVISPIAIDVDNFGAIYYTTTNRQKNSEFDIRGHSDWDIASIKLQTVEDRRNFLHRELSPENSFRNTWLKDINGDSSHDWKDLTIEKENVYKLTDINKDGRADHAQLIVNDFSEEITDVAGGVLKDGKDLYVAVAPDLWKMRDKNGDGVMDEKTSLSYGYGVHIGFSGHGMSGIEIGPDGRIYWQIGDIGFNGVDKDGRKWEHPNSGVIARSNPDGSDFEIFAHGLRNTHEFVFDEYGNLISEDNDGDHQGERERLVYIVNGSDAGWRSNWQYGKYSDPKNNSYKVWMEEKMYLPRFEGQTAFITPCISNFVSGPSGMVYNPGTALGAEYRNSFFIAEFVGSPANSGIHSFKLKTSGASFELGEHKKVVGGILPTGLDFGPDGALYVADWIDGWGTHDYGRIWKLDHKDAAGDQLRRETMLLLEKDFTDSDPQTLGNLLKHADMRVRKKAQFELVARKEKGMQVFKKMLAQREHQLARIHSIWGISQLARKDQKNGSAIIPYLSDTDTEIRAQAARWLGDIRLQEAASQIIPLLKDQNARVQFFAAEALGRMQHQQAIKPLINMLRQNNDADAYLRHAGTLALSRIGDAEPVLSLSTDSSRALRIAAVVSLRRMRHPGIARFLNDKDEFIVTETARAINDDLSISDALPALANLLTTTTFNNEALIRRAINANLRTGSDEAMNNLIAYAQKATAPSNMRSEALATISTWAEPSEVDRVDGRYRGIISRDLAVVKTKTRDMLISLASDKDPAIRISSTKAIGRLGIKESANTLLRLIKNDPNAELRTEALKSLAMLDTDQMAEGIRAALDDREKSVRTNALSMVNKLNISNELKVNLLALVIKNKTIEEKQAALISLAELPATETGSVINPLLDQMAAKKLPAGLYLELGDAIDSAGSADQISRYAKIRSELSEDVVLSAYAGAVEGGNAVRGQRIFMRNQQAMCTKCHSFDDRGGIAGPRLNGVGSRLSASQILESMINPSARIAPGFGSVTIELKDGKTITGIYQGETTKNITIKSGTDPETTIQKDLILKREYAMSSMPDMKNILSKREIRDLVSFLVTMKNDD